MEADHIVYAKIVAKKGSKDEETMHKCVEKLKKQFGNRFHEQPQFIGTTATIYLLGHGDDPKYNAVPGIGNKTPNEVAKDLEQILKATDFIKKEKFKGRIILEACHGAQFMFDKASIEMVKDLQKGHELLPLNGSQYLKLTKVKNGNNSFLAEFRKILNQKFKAYLQPQTSIGGYLGASFDGNYLKTGYGTSDSQNYLTVQFQKSRGNNGKKQQKGSFSYNQQESFIQGVIGKKLPYGQK